MSEPLIGKRFDMLVVKEFSHIGNKRSTYWKSKCDCGNIRIISTGELNRKRTPMKSCGCYRPFKDLSGKTFNFLTVVSEFSNEKGKRFWNCICKCGTEKIVAGESLTRNLTKSCGCWVKDKKIDRQNKAKDIFMKKTLKISNGCWEWTGSKDKDGYGLTSIYTYPDQRSHRSSFILFKESIPNGLCICHTCDNSSCVNPEHLYAGTVKQNTHDAIERGLFPIGPNPKKALNGEKNHKAKLDNEKVKYIRFLFDSGFKVSEMASFFNINKTQIQRIGKRTSWMHV